MKGKFSLTFTDKIIKTSIIASLVFIVVQILLVAVFINKLPPYIPFFNSRPWGEDRLSPAFAVALIPIFTIIVFLFNNFLSSFFHSKNVLIARIISFTALLFSILGVIAFTQIIFLTF